MAQRLLQQSRTWSETKESESACLNGVLETITGYKNHWNDGISVLLFFQDFFHGMNRYKEFSTSLIFIFFYVLILNKEMNLRDYIVFFVMNAFLKKSFQRNQYLLCLAGLCNDCHTSKFALARACIKMGWNWRATSDSMCHLSASKMSTTLLLFRMEIASI